MVISPVLEYPSSSRGHAFLKTSKITNCFLFWNGIHNRCCANDALYVVLCHVLLLFEAQPNEPRTKLSHIDNNTKIEYCGAMVEEVYYYSDAENLLKISHSTCTPVTATYSKAQIQRCNRFSSHPKIRTAYKLFYITHVVADRNRRQYARCCCSVCATKTIPNEGDEIYKFEIIQLIIERCSVDSKKETCDCCNSKNISKKYSRLGF